MSKPTMQDIADALSHRMESAKQPSRRFGFYACPDSSKSHRDGLFPHSLSGYHCDRLCSTASPLTHCGGSRVPTGVLSILDANHPSDCQGSFQA